MFYFLQPPAPRHCERSVAIQSPSSRHCEQSEAIQSPSPRHCERSVAIQSPSSRHCERSVAIQHPSSRHCERSVAIHRPHTRHCERNEAIQSPPPRHCERNEAIQSSSPRHCERSVAIQSSLPVIASEAKQSNPRASNLGVRFTLPTTPGIKFGGHFCIIDLSDTQIWAHSLTTDLSDTLILGSFLHHRPVRHPNLGVKLPAPRKLSPPSSQNQQTKANPRIYFLPPQEATTGSPQRNEVEIGRNWHEVPEGLCGGQEGRCRRQQEFSPITTIAVHL